MEKVWVSRKHHHHLACLRGAVKPKNQLFYRHFKNTKFKVGKNKKTDFKTRFFAFNNFEKTGNQQI
jgi:hypothetical protein